MKPHDYFMKNKVHNYTACVGEDYKV